ncbi:RNA polymerase sigma factor [Granulicella cerasi]|uniref:RNA polymerase sigma factor n=1 Tax=Granulicella cerasi TaxID=741063 RepID=A0ABW1ZBI8_9BACT|nr:sigma-70 family RNA polymerase sigma factor [Granulicella cerasi]
MAAMTISTGWLKGRNQTSAAWAPTVEVKLPEVMPQREVRRPQASRFETLPTNPDAGRQLNPANRPLGEQTKMSSPEDPNLKAEQPNAERAAMLAEQAALAELAVRCLTGDAEAWEKLARSQHRRVYAICYRFTGSQTDAEDMTQEVFLKMYRNLGSFDPTKGGFTTWLTTLTRNLLVDSYRRNRMDRVSDSLDEPMGEDENGPSRADRLADPRDNQERHVSGLQLRAQIQDALKQLSPELREAVILRDLEDMDYKDIADVLSVPPGTVKSRISRGRAELARLLKRLESEVM